MKEDVLKQLLEELLSSADESAPIGHGLSSEDLDINKQVIELVVNAGLMVLIQHRSVTGNTSLLLYMTAFADDRRFGQPRHALSCCNTDHRTKSTGSSGLRNEGHDNCRLVTCEDVCGIGADEGRRNQTGDYINLGRSAENVEGSKFKVMERSAKVYRNDKVLYFMFRLLSVCR